MARAREAAKVTPAKGGRSRFSFIRETCSELKKVIWPPRPELTRLTLMVLVVCAIMAVILGLFDWGFTELIRTLFL